MESKQGVPLPTRTKSTEGRETAVAAARALSVGGRRSLDSLAGAGSAPLGALPQPYWSSPTSHEVAKQQPEQAAQSASHRCALAQHYTWTISCTAEQPDLCQSLGPQKACQRECSIIHIVRPFCVLCSSTVSQP